MKWGVYPYGRTWRVRKHGARRALYIKPDRAHAITSALVVAKPGDRIYIHNKDGTVNRVIQK